MGIVPLHSIGIEVRRIELHETLDDKRETVCFERENEAMIDWLVEERPVLVDLVLCETIFAENGK